MSFYDEEIVGEGPCEFCGELFPLMLLIEHETIHLAEANYQIFDDDVNNSASENVVTELKKTEVIEEKQLKSAPEIDMKITVEEKQTKISDSINEFKTTTDNKQKQSGKENKKTENEKIKEFTTDKGEKLLVYGNDIDPDRDLDSDKSTYKMPNNLLLSNLLKEKDVEDINNLSDDDSSESLEEFWKRARDLLKRNRIKSECA